MLGLGNSLLTPDAKYKLVHSYTSDFTSNTDGFSPFSIQNSASDLVLTANSNPNDDLGGSAPDSDGWLKGVYGVTQTNASGIRKLNDSFSGDPDYQVKTCDYSHVSFKIYLFDDSNDYWENDDTYDGVFTGTFFCSGTNPGTRSAMTLVNTETEHSFLINHPGDTAFQLTLSFTGGLTNPQVGAIFYIKDILIKTYRPFG